MTPTPCTAWPGRQRDRSRRHSLRPERGEGAGEDVDARRWSVHVAETDDEHCAQEVDRIAISSGFAMPATHPDDEAQMFDLAPVSLWIEDFSAVRQLFEQWRADGVSDIVGGPTRGGQC